MDFADVRAIMTGAGSSLMGQGRASGKARARDAALAAISSPLLDVGIERATGIVWNITGPADLTLFEVNPSCTACVCEATETQDLAVNLVLCVTSRKLRSSTTTHPFCYGHDSSHV